MDKEKLKEKLKEWLSRLAANEKERTELRDFFVPGVGNFGACFSSTPSVHLYKCVRKIAELLELPCNNRIVKYEDGTKDIILSFMYEDMEFYELEDIEE